MFTYAAYNAAASDLADDQVRERRWYESLKDEDLIGGLELSFDGTLHRSGVRHLSGLLSPDWVNVITSIPGALRRARTDAWYGLASTREASRRQAISDAHDLFDELVELQQLSGERSVKAVELHSGPRAQGGASSPEAFTRSLTEIASWDWGSVQLSVEHVDAWVPGQVPEKGYLTLESECSSTIEASQRSGRRVKQNLNWARSAIETRSAAGPDAHLSYLLAQDNLAGIVFAGVCPVEVVGKHPWQDWHAPIDDVEPNSLL